MVVCLLVFVLSCLFVCVVLVLSFCLVGCLVVCLCVVCLFVCFVCLPAWFVSRSFVCSLFRPFVLDFVCVRVCVYGSVLCPVCSLFFSCFAWHLFVPVAFLFVSFVGYAFFFFDSFQTVPVIHRTYCVSLVVNQAGLSPVEPCKRRLHT